MMMGNNEETELDVCLLIGGRNVSALGFSVSARGAVTRNRRRSDKQQGALSQYSLLTVYHSLVYLTFFTSITAAVWITNIVVSVYALSIYYWLLSNRHNISISTSTE